MKYEQLIRGGRITTTTYSFSQSADVYARGQEAVIEALRSTFARLPAEQQDTVRDTFRMIEALTPLRFTEVALGEIRFAKADLANTISALGIGFFPAQGSASDSDVWFTTDSPKAAALDRPGYPEHLVLHEILHALGLQHPANQLTAGTSLSIYMGQKPGVQPLDLLALQAIYGAGDTLSGTAQDDALRLADARVDAVAGGAGSDALWLTGKRSDYVITVDGDKAVVSGNGFKTSVTGIERLNFITERGEQINRLYEAAWGGGADRAGFDYWTGNDTPLMQIAQALAPMAGDDAQFIQTLYAQALGRTPGADELAWHTATMDSRAAKLVEFSESPENQAQIVGLGLSEHSIFL